MLLARPRPVGSAALVAVLTGAILLSAPAAPAASGHAVPSAFTVRQHDRPAPGVDLYQGVLTDRPGADHWTLTVRTRGAHLVDEDTARTLVERLHAAGFDAGAERIGWPRGADREGLVGIRVRVGAYDDRAGADRRRAALTAAGFDAVTEWTGADGSPGTGLARIKVAVVDPRRYGGDLRASHGESVAGRETVTDMAVRGGALLAVNAGFFAMTPQDGVPGVAAGIAAYNGELQSGATNGRIAAVLRGDGLRPKLAHLSTESRVRAGDGSEILDGVNRVPGLIRNCGGTGGDLPTERPQHDLTCTDPDEIVLFTDELGADTPAGDGVEAVLDAGGTVRELRPRGGAVPAGGGVLAGVGTGEAWLRARAVPGTEVTVEHRILDERGRRLRLGPKDDIVNGGPQLVRDGRVAVDYGADGIERIGDPSFAYTWGLKRHPRTLLGVDGRGRLLLVVAEGRQPGRSDGLSLDEAARLMASLGAVDAMNLDGGGSTGLVLNGKMITTPSDATGERAVGDALLLTR